jgi:glucose-1-phosphate thymidylyltransferase
MTKPGFENNIIGLFPAGGKATRISPLPCSKEIYPIGFYLQGKSDEKRPKVVGHYLLEKMRLAGAKKAYIILRHEKWDIPSYFSDGKLLDMSIAYLMMDLPYGVPFTLDQAYPFINDAIVIFGFPDILFRPDDAYVQLLDRQAETGADLVLGLFPVDQSKKVDMVELDQHGRISGISIKPAETNLHYTWLIAVWSPAFSRFMHVFVRSLKQKYKEKNTFPEVFLGHVIQAAISSEIQIEKVVFEDGSYLDIEHRRIW